MKTIKKAMVICLMIGTLLAVGCQWDGANLGSQPAIRSAQLTEEEQQLITAVGVERTFAFDIDLDTIHFDQLEYKVDYYKQGEYVKTVTQGAMGSFLEGGTHRFMWSQTNTGTNQEQLWHVAFGGGRMTQQIELPEELTAWTWSQVEKVDTVELDQSVMLAALVGTSTHSMGGAGVIFDETEGGVDALEEYEAAYVLSVSFKDMK